MKKIRMKKKGQEEIMGFVIIVVVVAVIGLVFFGIMIRRGAQPFERQSGDISAFLESAMTFTSSCALRAEPDYASLGELARNCYSNSLSVCTSGEKVCDALNRTSVQLIESTFVLGPDRPYKGYIFNSTFVSETKSDKIITISRGNCSFNLIGGDYISPAYSGNIKTTLKLCY